MKPTDAIDAARVSLILGELRLPAIKTVWPDFAARADKDGWPAARFLATLTEHELAERARRRIERYLDEARLPPGKTLDSFDFNAVPMVSKGQDMERCMGGGYCWSDVHWMPKDDLLPLIRPPLVDKSRFGIHPMERTMTLLLLAVTGFLISTIAGAAGFASAVMAAAIWIHLIPAAHLVPVVLISSLSANALTLYRHRRYIRRDLLWPFLLGGLPGVLTGMAAAQAIDTAALRSTVGTCLLTFGLFALWRLRYGPCRKIEIGPMGDTVVGFAGGMLGGATAFSGVLPAIWSQYRNWTKEEQRGVYQTFGFLMNFAAAVLTFTVSRNGALSPSLDAVEFWSYLLAVVPATMLGSLIGYGVFISLNDTAFRAILHALIAVSGVITLIA